MKKPLLFILLIIFLVTSCNSSKQALKLISKQKFDKAQSILNKALAKDSLNADLYYVYSKLYTDTAFNKYDIDSSFFYIKKAIVDYDATDIKTKAKLDKLNIDSLALVQQKLLNDSLAYQRAKSVHTVQSYQRFLDEHPEAPQQDSATQIRNQLAFDAANALDTYEAYKNFMDTYPEAKQYSLAQERYNTLAFRVNTRTGNLKSYISFLQAFPESPFRAQAEEQILQITTASNEFSTYEKFIKEYPNSLHSYRAVNTLFHLYCQSYPKEAFFDRYPKLPFLDSLKRAAKIDQRILAPVFENQHYGLLNNLGEYVIEANFDLIPSGYFCHGVSDQVIHLATKKNNKLEHQILTKAGKLIHQYQLPSIDQEIPGNLHKQQVYEIGAGLLLIENEKGKYRLFHQSGFPIYPQSTINYPLDTAVLINKVVQTDTNNEVASFQFIKIQIDGLWGIISFTGRKLLKPDYEEIEAYGNFITLTQDIKIAITNRKNLIGTADQNPLQLNFKYDDVALIDEHHIVAYDGERETAINQGLQTVVPLGRHNIIRKIGVSDNLQEANISVNDSLSDTWLLRENRTEAFVRNDSLLNRNNAVYYLYDQQAREQQKDIYQKAYFNKRWVTLQNKQGFHFFDLQKPGGNTTYDSVKLLGENFALLFENYADAKDSVKVLFQNGGKLALVSPERLTYLLLKPNTSKAEKAREYILISPKNGPKEVWSQNGKRILQGNFDQVSIFPSDLFVIEQKGRKGLLDSLGNELIPPRYQGISNYKDGTLAVFQNKKFGTYRFASKTLIEPRYDAILQIYGQPLYHTEDSTYSELYIARKDDGYGIINQDNVQLSDFAFDEIRYWNDTSALVRQKDEWKILRFSRKVKFDEEQEYIIYDGIRDFKLIEEDSHEKIMKIYKKGGYGILSNQKGEILTPTYDDIRLFGSLKDSGSIYLSEKYVPEADLYLVIHLDMDGKIIKRQALTSEQYDMVFCEE